MKLVFITECQTAAYGEWEADLNILGEPEDYYFLQSALALLCSRKPAL